MKRLRIVIAGIENGDKDYIERTANNGGRASRWVVPKDSRAGDEVVIYISGYGFFATATIDGPTKKRKDRPNRYGATLTAIRLIEPAVSLAAIRRHIPQLTWANYPRSITTPDPDVAKEVLALIRHRRKTGLPDLDDDALHEANIDELRKVAIMRSQKSTSARRRKAVYRARSLAIKLYVLRRAEGFCEYCGEAAPFNKSDGSPYLEPHHTTRLADDGPDDPFHVITLCPNCVLPASMQFPDFRR